MLLLSLRPKFLLPEQEGILGETAFFQEGKCEYDMKPQSSVKAKSQDKSQCLVKKKKKQFVFSQDTAVSLVVFVPFMTSVLCAPYDGCALIMDSILSWDTALTIHISLR